MTVTVLDSADLVQATVTGVIPVPKGIAEDNAAQAAKRDAAKPEPKPTHVVVDNAPEKAAAPTAETPPDDAPDDDEEGEDGLTPKQKREFTASMQKTIAKKHRMQKEAEELATSEYNRGKLAEERATRLEREMATLKQQLNPKAEVEAPKQPARADFATDDAYQDALIDYRVDQKLQAKEAADATRAEEVRQQEVINHANALRDRAIELVPDFKEATEGVDMPVPQFIADYMLESDMFAELGYHFAKNPDVLTKLTEYTANVRPGTQAFVKGITRSLVELGKIESKLSPFSKEKVKNGEDAIEEPKSINGTQPSTETGSAPSKPRVQAPIIRPLSAGSGAQVTKDEGEMKTSEVITAWQKKHGVNLTARKRH